ncbi:MAG: hypothetical protein IAG10_31295 [Planctomycetaceae bacterium]|nr:hypothetical protein [Planctomycetaceae bacterium]
MSVRNLLWRAVVVTLTLALSVGTAEAQKKGGGKSGTKGSSVKVGAGMPTPEQIQKSVEQIDKAIQERQKSFDEAKKKLDMVQQEHHSAELLHRQQLRDLSQAKKFAAQTAKQDPAWSAARAKAVDLQKEMADVRKQVVESLREREDYRQAIQAREAALAKQSSSRGSEVTDDERKRLIQKVSESTQAIRTLEDVVLADRSDAKELARKLKDAEAEVAQAAKKAHDLENNDSKVASAKVGFVRTSAALKEAQQRLAESQNAAAGIQSGIQALAQQKAGLTAQEQMLKKLGASGGTNKGSSKNNKK